MASNGLLGFCIQKTLDFAAVSTRQINDESSWVASGVADDVWPSTGVELTLP